MKKLLCLLWVVCIIFGGFSITNYAAADIPVGVKDHYTYNQTDSSIVTVKKRLLELGYFRKSATFSNVVSDTLKEAVLEFQKQNGMTADGVIDRELLELLFSDDAVEKGGKPKTKNIDVTEVSWDDTKTEVVAEESTKQKTNRHVKENALSALSVFLFIAVIVPCVIGIFYAAQNKKRKGIIIILQRYLRMRGDPRCTKAINEAGIALNILASGGEYFLLPLQWKREQYNLYYDRNSVLKAEKQCGTSIISMLDGIAREGLNNDINRKLCKIWGSRKNGRSIGDIGKDEYEKTMYLYSSLVSSGIIKSDDVMSRDAFLFLVWECALDANIRNKEILEKHVNEVKRSLREDDKNDIYGARAFKKSRNTVNGSGDISDIVYYLYEVLDVDANTITTLMTSKEYIDNGKTMWHSLWSKNEKEVKTIIDEIEKRRYVDNLLKGKGRPRVGIQSTDNMPPAKFEKLIAVLFGKMGYNAQVTKLSGDQGVDVIADKKGRRAVIQVKCYTNSVGNAAVQQVVAGKQFYRAVDAYVVTNSFFTRSALELANANNVTLWNRSALAQMLDRYIVYYSDLD